MESSVPSPPKSVAQPEMKCVMPRAIVRKSFFVCRPANLVRLSQFSTRYIPYFKASCCVPWWVLCPVGVFFRNWTPPPLALPLLTGLKRIDKLPRKREPLFVVALTDIRTREYLAHAKLLSNSLFNAFSFGYSGLRKKGTRTKKIRLRYYTFLGCNVLTTCFLTHLPQKNFLR